MLLRTTFASEPAERTSWSWKRLYWARHTQCEWTRISLMLERVERVSHTRTRPSSPALSSWCDTLGLKSTSRTSTLCARSMQKASRCERRSHPRTDKSLAVAITWPLVGLHEARVERARPPRFSVGASANVSLGLSDDSVSRRQMRKKPSSSDATRSSAPFGFQYTLEWILQLVYEESIALQREKQIFTHKCTRNINNKRTLLQDLRGPQAFQVP